MGKYIGFILCVVLAVGIGFLSLMQDSLSCTDDKCYMQSKLSYINVVINEDFFSKDDVESILCSSKSQPSRRGKNTYYVLELSKIDDTKYILGSYKKYPQCNNDLITIKKFFKGKMPSFSYNSGIGFSNAMGFIFAFVLLFAGIVILTSKTTTVIEDDEWDDEDDTKK